MQLVGKEPDVWRHLEILKANTFLLDQHTFYNDGSPLYLHMGLDLGNQQCFHLYVVVYDINTMDKRISLPERNKCVTSSGIRRFPCSGITVYQKAA